MKLPSIQLPSITQAVKLAKTVEALRAQPLKLARSVVADVFERTQAVQRQTVELASGAVAAGAQVGVAVARYAVESDLVKALHLAEHTKGQMQQVDQLVQGLVGEVAKLRDANAAGQLRGDGAQRVAQNLERAAQSLGDLRSAVSDL